eukprot:TRINITY_DN1646_c0_g1_i2.p1 TRINITY_DN1646_c0_g1~~TRINITY_DN1646_c0_g1_i2.p1  ORF type:complete len:229 (-),score=21.34 TRINITY_DN1646_c0_g1_i2:73-711(-)
MSDRGPSRRVYVGRLSTRTRDTDLEAAFDKYGRCRVDLKSGFAFVEYDDERDAEDAIRALDNTDLDGSRIVVEQSHGRRGGGPGGPGGPSGGDSCFACGGRGHWARDCPSSRSGDTRGRCYTCGEPGHISRECRDRRGGGGGGGGGRGGYSSRGRSRSRSRSPRRRSRSPSPRRRSPSPRGRSPSPRRRSPSPRRSSTDATNGAPRSPPRSP